MRANCPLSTVKRAPVSGKVHEARRFAQRDVVGRVGLVDDGAPAAHLDVVGFRGTIGHIGLRDVGQRGGELVELGLHLVQRGLGGLQAAFQLLHFGHHRGDVAALLLDQTDVFGATVALGLKLLSFGLQGLAAGFQRGDGGVARVAAPGKARCDGRQVSAQLLGVEHESGFRND